jgi:hypothetical protein
MNHVRYTPLMKQYLEKVMPLAERLKCEDTAKSRLQLEAETALMIEYMQTIQLINRYDDGENFGAMLRRKLADLFEDLQRRLRWNDGCTAG